MRGAFVRRAVVAGAAAAVVGGVSFGASAFADGPGGAAPGAAPQARATGATASARAARPAAGEEGKPAVVRQLVAKGRVDGVAWSVTEEFHPALPAGYELPSPPPGAPAGTAATALLCQRMVIGGVRVDHQGGPWSDCRPLDGAHDPAGGGEEGLWGLHDKGTTGTRLFVANPAKGSATVATGVVTLGDGTRLTARTVDVPGTDYGTWAVAIPDGKTIAAVDQYDARHHRVSHETGWR